MEGLLTRAQPDLAQLPQCAQLVVHKYIAGSTCGFDIACICQRSDFIAFFQGSVLLGCSPANQDEALNAIKQLCTSAAPSLNDNRGLDIIAATTVTTVLAFLAVVLRFVSRHISAAKFGMDDVMILVALLFSFGEDINSMIAVPLGGYGRHLITLSLKEEINFAKFYAVTQLLFAVAITSTKISILFFYRRIFPFKRFKTICVATGCVMIAWAIALILAVFFGCRPFRYTWDKTVPGGHCVNENAVGYGITATNIVTDIVVLVLPIPWLWKLQLETSRKLAIVGIFLLGCFVCIACIVRLPLLVELDPADVTWTIVNAGIWINVECNIGIVSACLPIMRPLLNFGWPHLLPSHFSPHRHPSHRGRKTSLRLFDEEIATGSTQVATINTIAEGATGKKQKQQQREGRGKKDGRGEKKKSWFENALRLEDDVMDEADDGTVVEEEMVPVGGIAVKHELDQNEGDRH